MALKDLADRVRKAWSEIKPENKKKIAVSCAVFLVVLLGLLGYLCRERGVREERRREEVKKIRISPDILEKSFVMDTKREIRKLRKEVEVIKKVVEELEKEKKEEEAGEKKEEGKEKEEEKKPLLFRKLPPPPPPPSPSAPPEKGRALKRKPVIATEQVGDIGIAEGEKKKEKEEKKEVKKNVLFLPPSFMEATLLSGLYAPTMEGASKNPIPVLIRIKDLAILPNQVKADLKGCFVIGEGYGSLADERVRVRLVTLSCIAKNGRSIINQKVKGFVVDQDGKVGLRGRVVTKMGAFLARHLMAGFLMGFGQAYEEEAYSTSVSALGEVKTTRPGSAFKRGVGKGVGSAAKELANFYMKLAEQTFPVIEVGALRDVTVVISEGTELRIKEYNINMEGEESWWRM